MVVIVDMETVKIYFTGDEQSKWREQVINSINYNYDCEKKAVFFNPMNYYIFEDARHRTEREIVEFNLNVLRSSNLVIVNFDDISSPSTCAELAIAYEKRIPIVGINKDNKELHPWLVEFVSRICDNLREAVEYVVNFYLN